MSLSRRSFIGTLLCATVGTQLVNRALAGGVASMKPVIRFPEGRKLRFLQVTDTHIDHNSMNNRSYKLLRYVIRTQKPDFIVMTGDLTTGTNKKSEFGRNMKNLIDIYVNEKIPFAVTFGNHDAENHAPDRWNREGQYQVYKQLGGAYFIDHDVPELSGAGSGVIRIENAAGKPITDLYLMDSGAYSSKGGYDACRTDQIAYYEKTSTKTPVMWFQHLPVPEIMTQGLFRKVEEGTLGSIKYRDAFYCLNAERTFGLFNERVCDPNMETYADEAHTYEGRTLYQSWVKMGNVSGVFFGHEHRNSFYGKDDNGIVIGYTKGIHPTFYSDGNAGMRTFNMAEDGTYTADCMVESHVDGMGLLHPIAKNQLRLMSYNIYHGVGQDGKLNLVRTAKVIRSQHPSCVALQEVEVNASRSDNYDIPKELGAITGMYPTFAQAIPFAGGSYGNAVLTQEKPLSVKRFPLPGGEPRVLLCVELEKIVFFATHLALRESEQIASLEVIKKAMAEYTKPIAFAGDLNFKPGSEPYKAYSECFVWTNEKNAPTYPSKEPKSCIDYIAVCKKSADKLSLSNSHVVPESVASDHRPIVATLTVKA